MIPLEDDVRARFASIAAPDVPAPSTASLRKRAHRIRTTRIAAAAASIAVVAAGVGIGATTLGNEKKHADFAAGVTAIPGHVHAVPPTSPQWQFADTTLNGKHLVAVSFRNGTSICITGDAGGGCHLANEHLTTVAEVVYSRDSDIRSVAGFVPISASKVVVHLGTRTSTVDAVRTPTSNEWRFFAAFFKNQPSDDSYQPVVAVFDAQGQPTGAPVPNEGPVPVLGHSHLQNLPAEQWSLPAGDGGYTPIAYKRNDGTSCMAVTGVPAGTNERGSVCAASPPATARVLLEVAAVVRLDSDARGRPEVDQQHHRVGLRRNVEHLAAADPRSK